MYALATNATLWGETANSQNRTQVDGNVLRFSTLPAKAIDEQKPDAQGYSLGYAYVPSVIYANGFNMYFCSEQPGGGDAIRYSSSTNRLNWSVPIMVLQHNLTDDNSCDPSVVYYNAGDGGYYYMFYGGSPPPFNTAIYVARSATPAGPFQKYTDRGTWELNPPDPKIIIYPAYATSNYYGAGQPSIVVANGQLYMWHEDTTVYYPGPEVNRVLFRTSVDAVNWSAPIITNIDDPGANGDVKYNPTTGQFVWFNVTNFGNASNSYFIVRTSWEGISWGADQILPPNRVFTALGGTLGVSGDSNGWIIPGQTIAFYSTPYNLDPAYYTVFNSDVYGASLVGWGF